LSDVSKFGEQSSEAAHGGADRKWGEEHREYSVHTFEELLHVKFCRVCGRAAVSLDSSAKRKIFLYFFDLKAWDFKGNTYWARVIETASFRTLSPKTRAYKLTFTLWSWNIANIVTFKTLLIQSMR